MREVIVAIDPIGCGMARHVEREEIVRCRDCRLAVAVPDGSLTCRRGWLVAGYEGRMDVEILSVEVEQDGFCAWGRRRVA